MTQSDQSAFLASLWRALAPAVPHPEDRSPHAVAIREALRLVNAASDEPEVKP